MNSARARGVRRLCDLPLRRNAFRQHLLKQKRDEPPSPPPPVKGPLARVATATVRPHAVDALKSQYAALFQGDGPYASTPGFRGSVLLVDELRLQLSQLLRLALDLAALLLQEVGHVI